MDQGWLWEQMKVFIPNSQKARQTLPSTPSNFALRRCLVSGHDEDGAPGIGSIASSCTCAISTMHMTTRPTCFQPKLSVSFSTVGHIVDRRPDPAAATLGNDSRFTRFKRGAQRL